MRVLLIAYEYPPVESAQSLRWHYLGRELVGAGHELTVLTPELTPATAPHTPSIGVIRTWPGPFVGLSARLSRRRMEAATDGASATPDSPLVRLYRLLRGFLDQVLFPDVRTEWYPFAHRAVNRLGATSFDAVIASHEPGVDLLLGLSVARRLKLPLIVDLGDPLVTPYSPRWRRRLDRWLERRACTRASGVITTTARLQARLAQRHQLDPDRMIVIEQGFDRDVESCDTGHLSLPEDAFWLFFSGNFYREFRSPENFLRALSTTPGVRLVYAGHTPDWLLELFQRAADRVIPLGRLPHPTVLAVQRRAPLLLSIGNRSRDQLPGKLYEYLGADRPILHLAYHADDEAGGVLDRTRRGRCVANEPAPIAAALETFRDRWRAGTLDQEWNLEPAAVAAYGWPALGQRLASFLERRIQWI